MQTLLVYLALSALALGSPGLEWKAPIPAPTEYRVFVSVNGGEFKPVPTSGPIIGTSLDFTFPMPPGERSFYVKAIYETVVSEPSNIVAIPAPPKKARQSAKFFSQWWSSIPH